MYNKVILVGNLTKNIDLRYFQNGNAFAKTGIATNRKFTSANGEKKEEVCFIDITFFGRTAEIANQYLKKGSKVLVEGRLNLEQWADNNGTNRSKHSVIVESMKLLGDTQSSGVDPTPTKQSESVKQEQQTKQFTQVAIPSDTDLDKQLKKTEEFVRKLETKKDITTQEQEHGDGDVLPF